MKLKKPVINRKNDERKQNREIKHGSASFYTDNAPRGKFMPAEKIPLVHIHHERTRAVDGEKVKMWNNMLIS